MDLLNELGINNLRGSVKLQTASGYPLFAIRRAIPLALVGGGIVPVLLATA